MNRSVSAGVLIGAIVAAGGVIAGQRFIGESGRPAIVSSCEAQPSAAPAEGAGPAERHLDDSAGAGAVESADRETLQNDRYRGVANACGPATQ